MIGYDGPVSLEMEDLTMDPLTALKMSTHVLKEALPKDFDEKICYVLLKKVLLVFPY